MLLVWFGEEGVVPLPPPPFDPGKDTGAFVRGEGGGWGNHKELQHLCRYKKKKINGRLFFKKSQRKLPFFLQTSCLLSGKRPSIAQPQRAGKTKAFLGGAAGPAAAGERRELGVRCGAQA